MGGARADDQLIRRRVGLLEAAIHRPRASVFGQDAYPDLFAKAAALLHSLARNHPLVDGNERLAWLATYVFLAKNDVELDPGDDDAYDLVVAVAAGKLEDADDIAAVLASFPGRAAAEHRRSLSGRRPSGRPSY